MEPTAMTKYKHAINMTCQLSGYRRGMNGPFQIKSRGRGLSRPRTMKNAIVRSKKKVVHSSRVFRRGRRFSHVRMYVCTYVCVYVWMQQIDERAEEES